jgi:hypothetical protein
MTIEAKDSCNPKHRWSSMLDRSTFESDGEARRNRDVRTCLLCLSGASGSLFAVIFPPYTIRSKARKEEAESVVTVGNENKIIDLVNKNYRSPFEKGVMFGRDVLVHFSVSV